MPGPDYKPQPPDPSESLNQFCAKLPTEEEADAQVEAQKRVMGLGDPFPPGHLGDWMVQLRGENDRYRWGLQWVLNNLTGIDHEWAKEACNIARQSLNPHLHKVDSGGTTGGTA